jgi:hypothetical protein
LITFAIIFNIYLLYRKIHEKKYGDVVINDIYALLTAESVDKIDQLFDKIQICEESTAG